MTIASEISSGNLTKIRAGQYRQMQLVATVPDVVVVQFLPSTDSTASIYASIPVGSVQQGDMSDIKTLMTVIYSTSSDYGATEVWRTYVRKVDGTDTLYIGQSGQSHTTATYITVLNTYDPFELPRTERGGVEYANWDIAFRRLLPTEGALPSAVVLPAGTTAWNPTASPQPMDADATSSFTHAWESSNSNDTLDSGGATASPSWTLEAAAHRWIRYTYTDSNGNANTRLISVWTVPKSLATVVNLGFVDETGEVANLSYSQSDGWSCSVPAVNGISDLRSHTYICVFSLEYYQGTLQSIEGNIDFVGYLGDESTETAGNEEAGQSSRTRFTLNGFGTWMQNIGIAPVAPVNSASPSAWNQIETPTPARVISYLLTEHTTFLNLCPFTFPANHTDFIGSDQVFTSESDRAKDAVDYQANAMDAIIQFSRSGTIDMTVNISQTNDTARDAAPVVCAMTPDDWESYTIDIQATPAIRFLECYAGVYNSSTGEYSIFQAFAPPMPDIQGVGEENRPNIVLTADATIPNAQLECAQRTADLYAALNPTDVMRMALKPAWRFLQPDVGAWYTFTVPMTNNVRGISYDTNTRWQLLEFSYTGNNETGVPAVNAVFRKETRDDGANIDVAQLRYATDQAAVDFVTRPAVLAPYTGGSLELTDGEWFDSASPTAPDEPIPPATSDCEQLQLRVQDGATGVETEGSALNGEQITVSVRGSGVLASTGDPAPVTYTDDLESGGESGFTYEVDGGNPFDGLDGGSITPGVGEGGGFGVEGVYVDSEPDNGRDHVAILIDLEEERTVTSTSFRYRAGGSATVNTTAAIYYDNTQTEISRDLNEGFPASGAWRSATDNTGEMGVRYILFVLNVNNADDTGKAYIDTPSVTYIGEVETDSVYGDAYYYATDAAFSDAQPYGAGAGFLTDGDQPGAIPAYNGNHSYVHTQTVTSGPVDFSFLSPNGNENASNWALDIEICFEGVP